MKNRILKYGLWAFLWLVYMYPVWAYPGSPESGENEDETGAPIDNWQFLLIMVAIMLATHYLIRGKKKETV